MRRACWALTNCMSISRGFRNASSTASLVISWNTTRLGGLARSCHSAAVWRCQEIASPSRSGSVAKKISLASLPAFLICVSRERLSFMMT